MEGLTDTGSNIYVLTLGKERWNVKESQAGESQEESHCGGLLGNTIC